MQLRLEDELVTFNDVCDGLPLELVLTNVNATNEGYYECVTELINGSLRRTSAGFLRTISKQLTLSKTTHVLTPLSILL